MSVSAQWSERFEDKKCRICGFADISNTNIFNDKILRNKITTVFPIILHQDDPLPKNICRKCASTVSSMFNDVQRVMKLQNKWIQNVRSKEPGNNLFQTLNLLENATEAVRKLMNTTFGTTVPSDTITQLITTKLGEVEKESCTPSIKSSENTPVNGSGLSGVPHKCESNKIKTEKVNDEEMEEVPTNQIFENKKSNSHDPSPLNIACRYCSLQFESLPKLSLHQSTHMKIRIPRLFQKKFLNKRLRRGRLIVINDRQSIRCLNCWRIFDDNKCILDHWSKAECEFYCQICGKEYEQSPKMLREHVQDDHGVNYKSLKSQKDNLVKKTMSSSKSKQLNDSSDYKRPRGRKMSQPQNNPEPKTSNKLNKLVTCRICSRTFQNFKACNSHMRAHKPPYAYGETAPLPDVDADAYVDGEHKDKEIKPDPIKDIPQPEVDTSVSEIPSNVSTPPVTVSPNPLVHNTEPQSERKPDLSVDTKLNTTQAPSSQITTKITTSTAPRGIRMKFVSRRSDLNGSAPSIKVKSLSDLQGGKHPLVIPNQTPVVNKVQNIIPLASPSVPLITSFISPNIKDEPLENMFT